MEGNIEASDNDLDEQPSRIMPRDWYKLLRILTMHEHHMAQLFRQTHGVKEFSFDNMLKEMAKDFGVPYEKLRDVKFRIIFEDNE